VSSGPAVLVPLSQVLLAALALLLLALEYRRTTSRANAGAESTAWMPTT
jgi:hypothetical protein